MNSPQHPRRWSWSGLVVRGAALALAAGAITGAAAPEGPREGAAPDTVQAYAPPLNPADLLLVDDEMRQFFQHRITSRLSDRDRLRQLVEAILLRSGLGFSYDAEGTTDARETFRQRRGNCVSFSMLFVAVARDLGFQALFQTIETEDRWDRFGEIVASVQHVNVRVDAADGTYVVDLRPDLVANATAEARRVVPDERAFAQFYNTFGFFRLVHGDDMDALRYMIHGTSIDPTFAGGWANIGSLHARLGQLFASRPCYERSIKIDPDEMVALDGYIGVLRRIGSPDDLQRASKLERRVRHVRDRNPYYHQYLAQQAQLRDDLHAAEKSARRAISLKRDEPDLYVTWIGILRQLGRDDDARRASEKLDKLRARIAADSAAETL